MHYNHKSNALLKNHQLFGTRRVKEVAVQIRSKKKTQKCTLPSGSGKAD